MNRLPQNFKNGRHDRNGVDRSVYTGCCDAARDGFNGSKFDKYQDQPDNSAYFANIDRLKKEGKI